MYTSPTHRNTPKVHGEMTKRHQMRTQTFFSFESYFQTEGSHVTTQQAVLQLSNHSPSSHILKSAFDNVWFVSHNRHGTVGASPAGEILHLVFICWGKSAMESFVGQAGAASSACTKYDTLMGRWDPTTGVAQLVLVLLEKSCIWSLFVGLNLP